MNGHFATAEMKVALGKWNLDVVFPKDGIDRKAKVAGHDEAALNIWDEDP